MCSACDHHVAHLLFNPPVVHCFFGHFVVVHCLNFLVLYNGYGLRRNGTGDGSGGNNGGGDGNHFLLISLFGPLIAHHLPSHFLIHCALGAHVI